MKYLLGSKFASEWPWGGAATFLIGPMPQKLQMDSCSEPKLVACLCQHRPGAKLEK